MTRARRITALAALVLASAAQATLAQVLQFVPSDAMMVVKVNGLQETSKNIATLSRNMGFAEMAPALADPLAALREQMGIQEGLNADGDMAIVTLDPQAVGGDEERAVLALIPVSDFQAFLKNFQDVQTEGEVSQFTIPQSGDTAYAAKWGDYAAVSPAREVVAAKPQGALQPQGIAAKQLDDKDIVAYFNMPKIQAKAAPELKRFQRRMERQMQRAQENGAATQPAAARAMANQMVQLAERFLNETNGATIGVDFAEGGIKTTLLADFKPDSYLGNVAQKIQAADQPLLAGLPPATYLFYGGFKVSPALVNSLVDDFFQPLAQQVAQEGGDAATANQFAQNLKQVYASTDAIAMGVMAPTGGIGQEPLFKTVTVITGDADAIVKGQQQLMENQNQFMQMFTGQQGAEVKTTWTDDAKTVAGVQFDRFTTEFDMGDQTPEAMQAQQMMTMMYGPEGMTGYMGKIDDRHLLAVSGLNDQAIQQAVTAVKENSTAVAQAEGVKAVEEQLPDRRFAVMYVPLDNIATTAVAYAKQFGMPVNFQLPPNLPPIGAAASTEQTAIRIDTYVPAQLIQSLVAAGMQTYMLMQQGGGQPGGL